ncbi:hypothetical protein G3N96_08860 [Burkholderia sp. Se-20373]|uniref:hypothetical protein n=1 Tax=Burkholderia sp. Se-20373 TaxID=2703898 RepID=UPI0019812CB5|nr:hypothetical protein [Burkholderia sp. Se-20373]MBN3745543.1 hypothetical protein [Burkholderia sp. Se-20373]
MHARQLEFGLLIFVGRLGIGDDAAARAGTDVTAVQSTRDLAELIAMRLRRREAAYAVKGDDALAS